MTIKMPDGRRWITGFSVSPAGKTLFKGREISARECLDRTGWTLDAIRKRMRDTDVTIEESVNAPNPGPGHRLGIFALRKWLDTVYRPWRRALEPVPALPAPPQPNGPEPAPAPPQSPPEAFTLRVEAVSPDLVLKAFEAMAERLDAIEAQLSLLNKELH